MCRMEWCEGHCSLERHYEALLLFSEFHRVGLRPNDVTLHTLARLVKSKQNVLEWQLKQHKAYVTKLFMYNDDDGLMLLHGIRHCFGFLREVKLRNLLIVLWI